MIKVIFMYQIHILNVSCQVATILSLNTCLIKLTSLGTSHTVLIDLSVSLLTDALPHQVHVLMGANSVFPQTVLVIHARSQA